MPINGFFSRPTALLFDKELLPRISVIVGILLVSVTWALIVLSAAIADNTLQLTPPGRGLMNHYGFLASLLAAPLVLLTAYQAVSYFLRILKDVDELLAPRANVSFVKEIIRPHIDSILLRGKWRNMLWLFMLVGAASSIAIFTRLSDPISYWGNDVFNATYYHYSFWIANAFLLWLWSAVYPIGFFYALHLTLSTSIIVAQLQRRSFLCLNFLSADKCAGMAKFGTLNFIVMLIYAWPSAAAYAFHFTHQSQYLSLVLGACCVSILLIGQSFYGLYWVARIIRSERKATVAMLNDQIARAMNGARKNFAEATATLQYRERVLSVDSFPYSKGISAAVNALRFAPAALAVVRIFTS
jgi:hypothetical protein